MSEQALQHNTNEVKSSVEQSYFSIFYSAEVFGP